MSLSKRITAIMITLAMLCAVSCTGGTTTPAETTVGDGTMTSRVETTEVVTEEEPVDITSLLEGYTLHELSSDELESFRAGFPSDSALGNIAVKVTDYDGLYLLIEDKGVVDGNAYDRAIVHRLICGNTVQDCDITFAFGPYMFDLLKTDEYTVVGNQGYSSHFIVFGKDSCGEIPFNYGRDGACPFLTVENGQLCYKIENPIITYTFGDYSKILDTVTSEDEWRYEWGTVSLDGSNVILTKTKEQSMREGDFLRGLFVSGGQFETLEELLEYNRNKK